MLAAARSLSMVLGLVTYAACAPPPPPVTPVPSAAATTGASPAVSGEIVVFAASSLTDAFQDIARAFAADNPTARVTFNFGSSSQLATQLGQGARADVFACADQAQMDNAKKASAIAGADQVFARNRLVVIVPKDNPRKVASLKDLAQEGLKFVTAQPSVPIGQYTVQVLDKASADPAFAADFKDRVLKNVVSSEDNVRQVVSKVQLGEADAGVVYATDVTPQVRQQLQQIQIPDALQIIAAYPVAAARGANAAGGEAFVNFVLSATGQEILTRWGFLPAPATPTALRASTSGT
jgi:molybdate transport system substrate-binding protein